jgi:hypothetical protein
METSQVKLEDFKPLTPFQQAVILLLEKILSRIDDIAKVGE